MSPKNGVLFQLSIFALQLMHGRQVKKIQDSRECKHAADVAMLERVTQAKFQAMISAYKVVADRITSGYPYESIEHAQMDFEFEVTIKLIELGYTA